MDQTPKPMKGQMTVDECIEVAEKGLDGKETPAQRADRLFRETRRPTRPEPKRPLTAEEVVARRLQEAEDDSKDHR